MMRFHVGRQRDSDLEFRSTYNVSRKIRSHLPAASLHPLVKATLSLARDSRRHGAPTNPITRVRTQQEEGYDIFKHLAQLHALPYTRARVCAAAMTISAHAHQRDKRHAIGTVYSYVLFVRHR